MSFKRSINFKLGEKYIVDVTENGIIPLMKFDRDRWFDKDCDSLDFLTDEEKEVIVNELISNIRAEIQDMDLGFVDEDHRAGVAHGIMMFNKILDTYDPSKVESENKE